MWARALSRGARDELWRVARGTARASRRSSRNMVLPPSGAEELVQVNEDFVGHGCGSRNACSRRGGPGVRHAPGAGPFVRESSPATAFDVVEKVIELRPDEPDGGRPILRYGEGAGDRIALRGHLRLLVTLERRGAHRDQRHLARVEPSRRGARRVLLRHALGERSASDVLVFLRDLGLLFFGHDRNARRARRRRPTRRRFLILISVFHGSGFRWGTGSG